MIELPPSNLREYDLIWIRDTAIQLEEAPARPSRDEGEAVEAYEARIEAARVEVEAITTRNAERYLRAALETGDWSELLREGDKPTVFRCRQIPGAVWNAIATWRAHRQPSDHEYLTLVFRAGVVGFKDAPQAVKAEFTDDHRNEANERTGVGRVLKASVTDGLHAISKAIVPEIGALIARQRGGPAGK